MLHKRFLNAEGSLMFSTNRSLRGLVLVALLAGGTNFYACGGAQAPVEIEEEEEEVIEDIPGVVHGALDAFNQGIRAMRQTPTQYGEALDHFERATDLDPNFWEAWENKGLIYLDLNRFDEAVAAFEHELELIADLEGRAWPVEARPEVYLSLGKAHALAGRHQRAVDAFQVIIQIRDEQGEDAIELELVSEARANLAATFVAMGDNDQAREQINALLVASQDDVGALNVLASIYKDEGDMQMASYLWEKSLDLISFRLENLQDEDQYEEFGEEEEARVRYANEERIERLQQVLSDIQNELGLVQVAEGRPDRAHLLFRRAVHNNNRNVAAQLNLAVIYLDFADFANACNTFGEALMLRPREQRGLLGYAACAYGLGEFDDAYERYEAVLTNYPQSALAAQRLGEISFQNRNDLEAAIAWYERNLEIRGLDRNCEPTEDTICANISALREAQRQRRQQQEPRDPS